MKTLFIFLLTCIAAAGQIPVRAYTNSSYLLPGENTQFIIETTGEVSNFSIPKSDKYTLTHLSNRATRTSSGYGFLYTYQISSLTQGTHQIPSFEVEINGKKHATNPVTFEVLSSNKLEFEKVKIGNELVEYATAVFLPERDLYIGETVPTEIKIYLPYKPREFTVTETGLPELKRDGMSAWRYQNSNQNPRTISPFLLSKGQYYSLSYKSTAHALRSGIVSLGEGRARPVFKAVTTTHGYQRWVDQPIFLPIKKVERTALELPTGAPESFNGAVGNFNFDAKIDGKASTSLDTPISILLDVYGTGNLDIVQPPRLSDASNWKVFPATKTQREAERRYLSGKVEFTQLIRATAPQNHVPSFQFSYFNPETKSYKTLTSPIIPLTAQASPPSTPTTSPSPTQSNSKPSVQNIEVPVPTQNMGDVLDIITNPTLINSPLSQNYWKYWHILPALIVLWLLICVITRILIPKLSASPEKKRFTSEIKALQKENEASLFLKKAANLSILLPEPNDLTSELNNLRDEACFSQDKSNIKINSSTRGSILKKLNLAAKQLIIITTFTLCLPQFAKAEKTVEESHQEVLRYIEEKDYATARTAYLNAYPDNDFPPDIHNNLGTLYAKSEEPGLAMLNYRRTLLKQPNHPEAKQNLNFLERVHGSIVIRRTGLDYALSLIPLWSVKTVLHLSIWLTIIFLLVIILTRNERLRRVYSILFFINASTLFLAIVAIALYPKDGEFSPDERIAIVTAPTAVQAKTGASDESELVIIAPPGSVSKVLSQRGLWVYLEFTDKTRAWLNTKNVSMLLPNLDFQDINTIEEKSDL